VATEKENIFFWLKQEILENYEFLEFLEDREVFHTW